MSLKDRLNTSNKITKEAENKKEEQTPKYYESSEIANVDTLGIIDTLLIDDDLNSIHVSGAKNIYLERNGKKIKSNTFFRDNVQLENLIRKNALNVGIEPDETNPFISFNYKEGINVAASLPPLSTPANIFIKCYKDKHATIQTLAENLCISKEMSLILEILATIKNNIIIAGERNTLKTTTLSSLAKLLPSNSQGILIDFQEELKINSRNFSNFNFSKIQNTKTKIINSLINSNSDMLFINDPDKETIADICEKISEGLEGVIITICAKNPKEAMNKIALAILKQNPNLDYRTAEKFAHKAFNLMIFCNKQESGKRKISSISQITLDENENCKIEDIFFLNHLQEHESTGLVPEFFEATKVNNLPINSNIFDKTYKHTYCKNQNNITIEQFSQKNTNQDILKKFKKELPTKNIPEEETIRKVQEKFEEMKKNAKAEETKEITFFEEDLTEQPIEINQTENEQSNI